MILWAGISSKDVGMIVEHYPSIVIPRRKQEVQQVPGRNGDIILYQDAYENYEQSYQVFLDAKAKGGLQKVIPKLSDWLLGHSGYQRLEDSYFPDVYRMAYYTGGVEFISVFNEYGEGTLTFNCAPEKYYKMGERPISISNGQVISNPTLFPAKPLITIHGSGSGTIYFNNNSLAIKSIGGTMTIDVREHLAVNGGTAIIDEDIDDLIVDEGEPVSTSSGTLQNSQITGLFENMRLIGKTQIRWTGGISSMSLIPRWWTI